MLNSTLRKGNNHYNPSLDVQMMTKDHIVFCGIISLSSRWLQD